MSIYEKEDTSKNETEALKIVDSRESKKIFRNRILKALAAATAALISIISYNKDESDALGIVVMIVSLIYAGWAIKKRKENDQKVKIKQF